ncbi:MAG: hypothetical protein AB1798_01960 [Spirochaetota bacterium]
MHYRNEFTGSAVFRTREAKKVEKKFEFALEHTPNGTLNIKINLLEDLDYPLVPIIKTLKSHIVELSRKGKLP